MQLKSNFNVVLFSHVDYENLTAEVYFGDEFVALVSRENGAFQVEWASPGSGSARCYDLDGLLEALSVAKGRLAECEPAVTEDSA